MFSVLWALVQKILFICVYNVCIYKHVYVFMSICILYVCVCCVCLEMCAYTCEGERSMLNTFLSHLPPYVLRQVSY